MKPLIRQTVLMGMLSLASLFAHAQPMLREGVFTDAAGMSLYWWDNDVPGSGKSLCVGGCSLSWPPALAPADVQAAGEFSLVRRDDGTRQWAYKGRPLYRWVDDKQPGDRNGDGFRGGIWHLAKP